MKMKKYMIVLAFFAHTLYGCASESEKDSRLIVYSFDSSASLGDGIGDLEHARRLIGRFPKGLPLSHAEGIISSFKRGTYDAKKYGLTIVDRPAHVGITYDTLEFHEKVALPTIIFTEYLRHDFMYGSYAHRFKSTIVMPLGLQAGLGYMKPELPINHSETKKQIFDRLDKKWRDLIYDGHDIEQTLLILAYYSPDKKFPANVLKAFAESSYARGKRLIFFAKGEDTVIQELSRTIGALATVVTTKEFVPESDWHLLQQLAVATVATGDSSASDSFFFRTLPFWNFHKYTEGRTWINIAALSDEGGDVSNKTFNMTLMRSAPRIAQYLYELDQGIKRREADLDDPQDDDELIHFVRTIDARFMEDWKRFCAYMEDNYTFTPGKMAAAIDVGTKIVLGEKPDLSPYGTVLNEATSKWLSKWIKWKDLSRT